MSTPAKILVIEDEQPIRKFLRASLEGHGFTIVEVGNALDGIRDVATTQADLVILDLGLPDIDGLEVIKRIREWSNKPIIVLSARGEEADKVKALDAGADDYLTKPFGVSELLARIRVALRHASRGDAEADQPMFQVQHLKVDQVRRLVFVQENEVHLSPIEYRLLTTLIKHAGKVVTHKQLLKEVWGPHDTQETHYLRVYMGHLRHKIEIEPARPTILLTEPGVGYRLVDE